MASIAVRGRAEAAEAVVSVVTRSNVPDGAGDASRSISGCGGCLGWAHGCHRAVPQHRRRGAQPRQGPAHRHRQGPGGRRPCCAAPAPSAAAWAAGSRVTTSATSATTAGTTRRSTRSPARSSTGGASELGRELPDGMFGENLTTLRARRRRCPGGRALGGRGRGGARGVRPPHPVRDVPAPDGRARLGAPLHPRWAGPAPTCRSWQGDGAGRRRGRGRLPPGPRRHGARGLPRVHRVTSMPPGTCSTWAASTPSTTATSSARCAAGPGPRPPDRPLVWRLVRPTLVARPRHAGECVPKSHTASGLGVRRARRRRARRRGRGAGGGAPPARGATTRGMPRGRLRAPADAAVSTASRAATSSGVASPRTSRSGGVGGRRVVVRHQRGMFPCFLGGRVSRLVRSARSALVTFIRVLRRGDDGVDVAALGRDVGVGEGVLVLGDEPRRGPRRRPRRPRPRRRAACGRGC